MKKCKNRTINISNEEKRPKIQPTHRFPSLKKTKRKHHQARHHRPSKTYTAVNRKPLAALQTANWNLINSKKIPQFNNNLSTTQRKQNEHYTTNKEEIIISTTIKKIEEIPKIVSSLKYAGYEDASWWRCQGVLVVTAGR